MWTLLRSFLLRWVLLRDLLKTLGSLALLLPGALLLLKLGWTVQLALAVPVVLVLVLLGLPFATVAVVGATLIGIVGFAITAGLGLLGLLLPIALPIVAIVLLLRWLSKRPFRPGTDSI